MAKFQRVLDPVHGLIEFEDDLFGRMCWAVIQTREFQRLRRVKQLGFSELVFPGASHSRFVHSVGVFHTARRLNDVIRELKPDTHDTRRGQEAMAAALVHDLGHGPFSHAFEEVVKKVGVERHEATSVRIIRETGVADALDGFVPGFHKEVAAIISNKVPSDMHASIVSSQFDADRLDYMQRDRFMTGAKSSAIDFDWLTANLEVRRVPIGQDGTVIKEVETLVVGQKAVLAAEAYVLGLFHLYPTVYYHKTTRSAEKICSALLFQIIKQIMSGNESLTQLPSSHPIIRFAKNPNDLSSFQDLDDSSILGSLSLLKASKDKCISELSERLSERKFYKAIDVTARLTTPVKDGETEDERDERRRKAEAEVRERMKESGLLDPDGSGPRALEDVVSRDPYHQTQGDEAAFDRIYAVDRNGELKELSKLSRVVAALRKFEAYRIYYRDEDSATKEHLEKIIGGDLQ